MAHTRGWRRAHRAYSRCHRSYACRGYGGEQAAVEHIHAEFLRNHAGAVRVNEQELLDLPQLTQVMALSAESAPRCCGWIGPLVIALR